MSSRSAYFRGCTQTTFPGLRRYPGLKSSRITCNPRGHVTVLSHTVFTTDSDGAPFRTPWLCLHARRFLKGAGAARPAFRCCFGNRDSALANGRAGIMTCVFCVRINQTAADTRKILISSLTEENTLGNNTGIKQTHAIKPIKNQQSNPPMKGYRVHVRVCVLLFAAITTENPNFQISKVGNHIIFKWFPCLDLTCVCVCVYYMLISSCELLLLLWQVTEVDGGSGTHLWFLLPSGSSCLPVITINPQCSAAPLTIRK